MKNETSHCCCSDVWLALQIQSALSTCKLLNPTICSRGIDALTNDICFLPRKVSVSRLDISLQSALSCNTTKVPTAQNSQEQLLYSVSALFGGVMWQDDTQVQEKTQRN